MIHSSHVWLCTLHQSAEVTLWYPAQCLAYSRPSTTLFLWSMNILIQSSRETSHPLLHALCPRLKHVSPLLLILSLLCDRFQSHLERNQAAVKVWGLPEGKPRPHWLIDHHLLLLCFQSLSVQCLPLRDSNMFRYLLHMESICPVAGYIGQSRATNR